jgi:hypothetical protein
MLNATEHHRVGRPKNSTPTRKIEPMVPAGAYASLQRLAAMACYGSTPNEVARYLILRGLDDLIRSGVIGDKPTEQPSNDRPTVLCTAYTAHPEL